MTAGKGAEAGAGAEAGIEGVDAAGATAGTGIDVDMTVMTGEIAGIAAAGAEANTETGVTGGGCIRACVLALAAVLYPWLEQSVLVQHQAGNRQHNGCASIASCKCQRADWSTLS